MKKLLFLLPLLLLSFNTHVEAKDLKTITDEIEDKYENAVFTDFEYDEDSELIIIDVETNSVLGDETAIELFMTDVSYFFDELKETLETPNGIVFRGFFEETDGEEYAYALVYFDKEHVAQDWSKVTRDDTEIYKFAQKVDITSKYSQYLDDYIADREIDEDDKVDQWLLFNFTNPKD